MRKYVIGVDFGTLSARALVVDTQNGRELADATMEYPHGVMTDTLPTGEKLPPDWALQHPADYIMCLKRVITGAVAKSGINTSDIAGIGLDFTACTMIPVDKYGEPLCLKAEYARNPHSWVKLWKHHGAQAEANRITELAKSRGETFLARYGGKASSEWLLPKIWEVLNNAPEIYSAADRFVEAGDWIVEKLTGARTRTACTAGYKAMWSADTGYPSKDFLRALDPRLENLAAEKLPENVYPVGTKAGETTSEGAMLSGLPEGISVAVAEVDAHVSLPATGAVESGRMLMIMGTSLCDVMVSENYREVPGICGVVKDGVIPNLYGYEAGQTCMGDHFQWFAENCVPEKYVLEARERGITIQDLLTEKAAALRPGESGLVALDWWNGNRSVLVDVDLTGLMIGMTLSTRPEEIYRALIEATAYGARVIMDNFENHGVKIEGLYACGGISRKNALLMQIYADVLEREIRVVRSKQAPALGSAMFGAVAAGAAHGGYDDIAEAAKHMGGVEDRFYAPNPENAGIYKRLFGEYQALHDYFGRGGSDTMKRLKAIRGGISEHSKECEAR